MPGSRGRLLGDSAAAWATLRALPWRARWTDNPWREPFQLMTGALIHLENGLRSLRDSEFHVLLRPLPPHEPGRLLRCQKLPTFGRDRRLRTQFAQMHLASTSLRLPAAVFLHERFSRPALLSHLRTAQQLGCCLGTAGAAAPSFEVCLALVVAHRDEFAHGEIGDETPEWHGLRGQVLTASYRCRLAQAQMTLVQWLIGKLT